MIGPIPVEANTAKAQGNSAFAAGDYEQAATHYSRAVELAPQWAVPRANRAFAYMKQVRDPATEAGYRRTLRTRAMADAYLATRLDGRWGKGYARLAEAMLMDVEAEEAGEEAMNGAPGGTREEGRRKMLEGAQEALYHAVQFSEGRVLEEAQKMMEDVTARLEAL
ncbi:uncharacterized protein SCHCODRAFT_02604308 [Schizophyllum commune H4-8]|uniref:uncharacterized protein n=1 Tax=Schizophyllum commune (strain H4-8 / FGSC 9210) TaxID=578458 RepID=UPI00216005AE|nr:uncharacterized protein SCHCODRAFT_02604308 [Schizophyllum commune H4-8]KAI5899144.1 hypothetical protein SCHCODRAFT_02604308 [Schizophyllum commune H4-8]